MTDTTTTEPLTTETTSTSPTDRPPTPAEKPLFTDFGVDQDLADTLRERGIIHPFAIQELSLPLGLKGHDIIGQARTGTGKTLGFGLPLLQRIDPDRDQTQALVIVPTRELCIQVADDLTVGAGRGITSIAVYGGVGYEEQIAALTSGVHVVVGTPGRTLDHLGRGNLDVSQVHTVVLDEADEMLDMGFLPDVEKLLADVPTERQTLLFSATMPTAIVKLARRFMDKPTFMRADETLHETAPTVEQHFFLVHRMDKPRVLARLLQQPARGGAMVFCRTKRMCDRLVRELDPLGVDAIAVHGDLRQSTRERNLDRFRAGKADVLVATEVAARGLDVSNVTHVVNYDCPDDEKMYLHRIGRTARAGESGVAVTFAEFNEVDRVNVIRKRVGVEDELAEVFSTSGELTERFDLPPTTPWEEFGKSDGTGSETGRGRSGRRSARGGTGRDRSTASSSGSNRSSGRGSDRRGRSDESGPTARDGAGGRDGHASPGRRERTTTRDRGDTAEAPRTDEPQRSGRSRTRRGSETEGGGRSRTRTRTRTRTHDSERGRTDDAASRSAATAANDAPGRDESSDRSESRSSGSGRTSGGGRKRARRNRRSRTDDRGGGASRRDDRDDDTATDRSRSGSNRSGSNRSGTDRSGSDRSSSTASGSGRSGSRGTGSTRSGSRDPSRSGKPSSDPPTTTRRGSDARGTGTPRLGRRVDVEHLP